MRTITTLILRHVACIPEEDFIDLMLFVHHQLQLISVATDRQEQQIERERGGGGGGHMLTRCLTSTPHLPFLETLEVSSKHETHTLHPI